MGSKDELGDTEHQDETEHAEQDECVMSREITCPVTGYPIVAARPGQRGLSVEEIRNLLEDFP